MKRLVWILLSFMGGCEMMPAITLRPQDPNCIGYWDFQDAWRGIASDQSQSGLDFTLNGGPAWLDSKQAYAGWAENNSQAPASTFTYIPLFGHHIYFTATSGIDATTVSTTLFEFSGNKPFMMAWIMSIGDLTNYASQTSVFNWTQGANACGFSLEIAPGGNKNLNFVLTGVGGPIYWGPGNNKQMRDSRPHMYGMWRDEAGNVDIFYDGEFNNSFTGVADFNACAGGSALNIAKIKTGAGGEWSGRFGKFQIWNKTVPKNQNSNFFKAWYNQASE